MGVVDVQQEIIHDPDLDFQGPAAKEPDEGGGEQYRTILEIWAAVLKPAADEIGKKVLPQWGTRIIGNYPEITFADLTNFRDLYYSRILDLADTLDEHIDSDAECLKRISAEEDAQLNGMLYRKIITEWQKRFLLWELDWDNESEHAAIDLASMAEVHKMFFSQEGLITLLDQISLEFTDDDRENLAAELQELKEQVDAGHR